MRYYVHSTMYRFWYSSDYVIKLFIFMLIYTTSISICAEYIEYDIESYIKYSERHIYGGKNHIL